MICEKNKHKRRNDIPEDLVREDAIRAAVADLKKKQSAVEVVSGD